MKKRDVAGVLTPLLAATAGVTLGLAATVGASKGMPINPDVKQANIQQTICVPNWTDTVRPPEAYTNELKLDAIQKLPVEADHSPAHYEEDHKIALALGGAPKDPRNLVLETLSEAKVKDSLERALQRSVCVGLITLDQGRRVLWGVKTTP